jgi:quercetin dioxygenase-like cupin family protein
MRLSFAPALCLLVSGCTPGSPPEEGETSETLPAFGAASGVTRAETAGGASAFRVIPLRAPTGDVEILFGNPDNPGEPFVMRIRELPGTRIPLHSHPVDEHITVVQGQWFFALGERWDSTALKELTPGAYAFAPAGSTMFGYSPDGAIVQVHGIGPFHIRWRDGSTTLDDPDGTTKFRYRKGQRMRTARGTGRIRQGYASGAIVQYEIDTERGDRVMVDEQEATPL